MLNRLLATKFHAPAWRPDNVARPRLVERLQAGLGAGRQLTLIAAPAGYGKTILAAEWLHALAGRPPAAWLTLDEADDDPARFFACLIAALQTVEPGLGQAALSLTGAPAAAWSAEEWAAGPMAALINELAELESPLLCALDDYHLIADPRIHAALQFLLDHQPATFHLLLLTREDPPLALARLRARGRVTELRAADLRFTSAEAVAFFNRVLGLALAPEAVEALAGRTEGWIAGLQLAALSLQGLAPDATADFVAAFSGSHRYVMDYLLEEVLARQPADVRAFLRGTAVLERLCGPLCDAVLGINESANHEATNHEARSTPQTTCSTPFAERAASLWDSLIRHSHAILDHLDRANLFLIPLDAERRWYRYHRLFADFLRTELTREEEVAQHRRAAAWFAANGFAHEAIEHALRGEEWATAGCLIAAVADDALRRGETTMLADWLAALPADVVAGDQELLAQRALTALLTGAVADAGRWAARLAEIAAGQPGVPNGRSLAIRAWLATALGQPDVLALAQEACRVVPDADAFYKTLALIALGFAQNVAGDTAGANASFLRAYKLSQAAGQPLAAIGALANLCFNLLEEGRFSEADALAQEALARYVDRRGRPLPVLGVLYAPLAVLAYVRDDLAAAEAYGREALTLSRGLLSRSILGGDAEMALAQVYFARGEAERAYTSLSEARRAAERTGVTVVADRLALQEASLRLRGGDPASAERYLAAADQHALTSSQADVERRELLRARLALARGETAAAQRALADLGAEMSRSGRRARLTQIHVLRALAAQQAGDAAAASEHLRAGLRLAAAEGYRRAFLDAGQPVAGLLPAARSVAPAFVDDLLARFGAAPVGQFAVSASQPAGPPPPSLLVEPLSERELEILGLIAQGASNQAIADRLVITVGTAKWHLSNIYGKLGVRSRTQALARARALGLLPPDS